MTAVYKNPPKMCVCVSRECVTYVLDFHVVSLLRAGEA